MLAAKIGSMSRVGFVHQWHGEGTMKTGGVVYGTWLDAKIQSIARLNPGFCMRAAGCIRDCRDTKMSVFLASDLLSAPGSVLSL